MGEWVVLISFTLVVVAFLAAFSWYNHRKNNKKGRKAKGVQDNSGKIATIAKSFARSNGFKCISPAGISINGKHANLDAVVMGYFGIVAVKELAYNGEIYGGANEEDWLQITEQGERIYFKNPKIEASADVRVIREVLFGIKLRQIPVEVVYVFSDSKVQLAITKSTEYYTTKTFKTLLKKEKYL